MKDQPSALADYQVSKAFVESANALKDIDLLYHVPAARSSIVHFCLNAPLKPFYFRLIRALYKTAEAAMDTELQGILALRFETSPTAASTRWIPENNRWQQRKEGVFSINSKLYLLGRPEKFP